MRKRNQKKTKITNEETAAEGISMFENHDLFFWSARVFQEKNITNPACVVTSVGRIEVNTGYKELFTATEWFYLIVHQYLHLAFGHFDALTITGQNKEIAETGYIFQEKIWKLACDLYNIKFLTDMKIGKCPFSIEEFKIGSKNEKEIYEYLLEQELNEAQRYQIRKINEIISMEGLKQPLVHEKGNFYMKQFARRLSAIMHATIQKVNEEDVRAECSQKTRNAAEWFIAHYPLLGGLATGFQIVESYTECQKREIQIAAVDVCRAIIYINPAANLSEDELRFVLGHEYLHAGLMHHERCRGRDAYLWNVACDYVINGWLHELEVGKMPEGILYDEQLKNMSAESVYDMLVQNIRGSKRLLTLRGYGKRDVIWDDDEIASGNGTVDLDEFYKNALKQGLVYHESQGRGYLPAGLIEEIRALGMPPIPWDVELAKWFEEHFLLEEKHYSYARPSRRQSSSSDIPRPRLVEREKKDFDRTFGVIVDTSVSMSEKMLGMALGSIVSYAQAREVAKVRLVFCDAKAYDAGYIYPDDLVGRVEVTGRGGTVLQAGIDCLEQALDFPKDGPILIITDGEIESKLIIRRKHAFLLPKKKRLPFISKGKVFYLEGR